jgi:hypothetical protein
MARSAAIIVLLILTGAFLWGCSDPTSNEGPDPSTDWEIRDTPQHVLHNLINAYEEKDAEHYLDCLADDFIFFMNEEDAQANPPGYWGKAEERAIHEDMLGDNGADRITLTLTQVGDPVEMQQPGSPAPPAHWGYTETPDLRVTVGNLTYWASAASFFEFRIDQDQVGPEGETLWEICGWTDLEPGRGGASHESSSWGSIKALYR